MTTLSKLTGPNPHLVIQESLPQSHELDELDHEESTEQSMEMSAESCTLKHQSHEKCKQVQKAEKQARIQQLQSQLAETDHQLDILCQKASSQASSDKGSNQPVATSTPQATD